MPDNAATAEPTPPPDDPNAATEAAPEPPVTDWQAKATDLSNRFSGSQKRLNEELTAHKATAVELEAARKRLAEIQQANMTELERTQFERDEARKETEAARAEVQRLTLAQRFPLALAELGDGEPVPSEAALARIEAKLAAPAGDETELQPRIDPNNPRRSAPLPQKEKTGDDLVADLKAMGNPWAT